MAERAIILFAHGSRDALWKRPIEAVADRLRQLRPDARVCCAYLELDTPDLAGATLEMVAAGARHVTVLPMFLGIGRHAREDLPKLVLSVRSQHPDLVMDLRNAVGEDPQVLELLARIAAQQL